MPRKHGAHIKHEIIIIIIQRRRRRRKMVGEDRQGRMGEARLIAGQNQAEKGEKSWMMCHRLFCCCWPVRNLPVCQKDTFTFGPIGIEKWCHSLWFQRLLFDSIRRIQVGRWLEPTGTQRGQQQDETVGSFIKRGFGYIKMMLGSKSPNIYERSKYASKNTFTALERNFETEKNKNKKQERNNQRAKDD